MDGKFCRMLNSWKKNKILRILLNPFSKHRGRGFLTCKPLLTGKKGFEIGGPSPVFDRKGILPIYPIIGHLDNCNFSQNTIWERVINEGPNFFYDKKSQPGYQFIREGTELYGIPSESYDFVISSHTLEHIANPLRALYEWMRILKNDGIMVLILPHKDGTFDHLRPVTNLEHLINDFKQDVGEDDLSHLPEILRFHDLKMDPPAGNIEEFRKRSEKNFENRCLHHHAFDTRMVISMMNHIGLRIYSIEAILPFHIIGIGRKVELGQSINNTFISDGEIELRCESPFPSDQV